jgi:aspartyl-tRNA synthetase
MTHHVKHISEIAAEGFSKQGTVAGWIHDIRNLGGIAFILLRERDGIIQVTTLKKENRELFDKLVNLPRESVVKVFGTVQENKEVRNGWEILAKSFEVLSMAEAPLPLGVADKVGAEMDTRLNNRFMDLRKDTINAIFQSRSLFLEGVREYLAGEGFLEVHTPKIAAEGAEGGATLFQLDYFGRKAFLSQSPQLYKQILMGTGFDRVYEIAPAYRAELSDTVRHISEFTSYDAEMAFIETQDDVLKVLEHSVVSGMERVRSHGKKLFEVLEVDLKVPQTPVPRVTYADALGMLESEGKTIAKGEDIDTEGEKLIGKLMKEKGHDLYFIIEYPWSAQPFYKMVKDDNEFTHSFDLGYKGDEMASGGQREHRYDVLVKRMKEKGLNPDNFDFYLKPFRYGMPPHGGWGLGVERVIQKMLDLPNIRETVLFPRDRARLSP